MHAVYASGVKYSHFTCRPLSSWQNYMKNCLGPTGGQSGFTLQISKFNTGHDVWKNKSWISLFKLNIFSN